jgi:DNA-binding transcriptional MerR regulator
MKKAFFALAVLFAFCAQGFILQKATGVEPAQGFGFDGSTIAQRTAGTFRESRRLSDYFTNGGFSQFRQESGVYIIRDEKLVSQATDTDFFDVDIDPGKNITDPVDEGGLNIRHFDFQPVKEFGGQWYTAKEYHEKVLKTTSTVGVGEWFDIYVTDIDTGEKIKSTSACLAHFPVTAPAGKYGVRARSLYTNDYGVNFNELLDSDGNNIDFYFTILYGTTYQSIILKDSNGGTLFDVDEQYPNRVTYLSIISNSGAMRQGNMLQSGTKLANGNFKPGCDFDAGLIEDTPFDILFTDIADVHVSVSRNGRNYNGIQTKWLGNGRLGVQIPKNLPTGQYVVTVTHDFDTRIKGSYYIDNGVTAMKNTTQQSGIALIVIGFAGFAVGFLLVLTPQLSYFVNKLRYKTIDDRIYGKDPATIRKIERERKEALRLAKEEAKKQGLPPPKSLADLKPSSAAPERNFSSRLMEYRKKRDAAKELGISVEEYTAMLAKQGNKEEIAQFGLKEARKIMGEGVKIAEAKKKDNLQIIDDNPEFNVVETVKMENLTSVDQFQTITEEKKEEALNPIEAEEKGLLGKIRRFLEDGDKPHQ